MKHETVKRSEELSGAPDRARRAAQTPPGAGGRSRAAKASENLRHDGRAQATPSEPVIPPRMKPIVGRIVVYVSKTGMYEIGLVREVDAQKTATIRIFDSAPSVTLRRNVAYSAEKKPETWHFKSD